jgi:hypothetical protein
VPVATAQALRSDPILQFTVFTENKVGRLLEIVKLFTEHNVHVVALSSMDVSESSITRMVVDDPQRAKALFEELGIAFAETHLTVVEMNAVTDLQKILASLLQAEINIHYVYPFLGRPKGKAALAIHLEDEELAANVIMTAGFKILTQRDIAR